MKVLIVDDSLTIRSILKRMMTELGFETQDAPDGREALNAVNKANVFDVVLVDWNMPNMNGLEFVKNVRMNAAMNKMKIIMVTTESEISKMSEALSAGANEYIMKPFTKDIVKDKLLMLNIING